MSRKKIVIASPIHKQYNFNFSSKVSFLKTDSIFKMIHTHALNYIISKPEKTLW
jgi:hypothetical protein